MAKIESFLFLKKKVVHKKKYPTLHWNKNCCWNIIANIMNNHYTQKHRQFSEADSDTNWRRRGSNETFYNSGTAYHIHGRAQDCIKNDGTTAFVVGKKYSREEVATHGFCSFLCGKQFVCTRRVSRSTHKLCEKHHKMCTKNGWNGQHQCNGPHVSCSSGTSSEGNRFQDFLEYTSQGCQEYNELTMSSESPPHSGTSTPQPKILLTRSNIATIMPEILIGQIDARTSCSTTPEIHTGSENGHLKPKTGTLDFENTKLCAHSQEYKPQFIEKNTAADKHKDFLLLQKEIDAKRSEQIATVLRNIPGCEPDCESELQDSVQYFLQMWQ